MPLNDLAFPLQVLFEGLSVRSHLRLYAALKGLHGRQANAAVAALLESMGMAQRKRARSSDLSGGQKRKVNYH